MSVKLTTTVTGWRTWRFGCDICDRYLWTALEHHQSALEMAHANGWSVGDTTRCPACAAADAALSGVSGESMKRAR